jgi:hypothetical protein
MTNRSAFNLKEHLVFSAYSVIILAAVLIGGGQIIPGLETITPWTAFLMGFFSDSLVKNFSTFNPFKTS